MPDSEGSAILWLDIHSAAFDTNAKANQRGERELECQTIPPDERAMFDANVKNPLNKITQSNEGVGLSPAFAMPSTEKIVLSNEWMSLFPAFAVLSSDDAVFSMGRILQSSGKMPLPGEVARLLPSRGRLLFSGRDFPADFLLKLRRFPLNLRGFPLKLPRIR